MAYVESEIYTLKQEDSGSYVRLITSIGLTTITSGSISGEFV